MPKLSLLDRLILVALSALLVFSAVDKLFHYEGFLNAMRDYVLIPPGTAQLLALPVILLELFLGIALWVPVWRRLAFLATGALFLVFTVMIGANMYYGNRGVCGCWFSLTLAANGQLHIIQNLIFSGLAFMVASDIKPAPLEQPELGTSGTGPFP